MNDFLKKAKEAAGKVLDVAGEQVDKAKEFFGDAAELIKLECELAESKETRDKLLIKYGKLWYEEASDEEKVECKETIAEVDKVIGILEASIKEFKEAAERKAAEKEAQKNMVFCTNCGEKYEDKEKFCSKCGTKLKK